MNDQDRKFQLGLLIIITTGAIILSLFFIAMLYLTAQQCPTDNGPIIFSPVPADGSTR